MKYALILKLRYDNSLLTLLFNSKEDLNSKLEDIKLARASNVSVYINEELQVARMLDIVGIYRRQV